MKKIYKYQLEPEENQILSLPEDAKFIYAGMQKEKITIWAVIESMNRLRDYDIKIIGTGWNIPDYDDLRYIGTVQMITGFVWHIFYK